MILAECATTTTKYATTTDERRINYVEDDEEVDAIDCEEVDAIDNRTERERELKAQAKALKAEIKTLQQYKPKVIQKTWIQNKNGMFF